jgi:hypothetical protein
MDLAFKFTGLVPGVVMKLLVQSMLYLATVNIFFLEWP